MAYDLPSGAKLIISPAPFAEANALLKAILRSVRGLAVGKDVLGADIDPANPAASLRDAGVFMALVDKVLAVAVSDEVEEALFKVFERAAWNNRKINRDLFDDPADGEKARTDYYTMAFRAIEVNCKPFFAQTFSGLKLPARTVSATQKPT